MFIGLFTLVNVGAQSNWLNYRTISGVKIYTQEVDCRPVDNMAQKVILLKIENSNNYQIEISWDLRVWYDGKEMVNNSNPEQRHYSFYLDAKQSLEGDCTMLSNTKNLYIFKKFLDFEKSGELTKFELQNLKVTTH
ncbi:MAG: hypothetical protein ACWA41_09545 [Putridiphycobacter sp.]